MDSIASDVVGQRIDAVLRTARLDELVAAYFNPDGPFAAITFDTLEPAPPNQITVADLLAVSFLDVAVRPLATRRILGRDAATLERMLAPVPVSTPLWLASDDNLTAAAVVWDHLCAYGGIGPVIAGKLLSRKRPKLVPIVDSVIVRLLGRPEGGLWRSLRQSLTEKERRDRIESMRPASAPASVSTLRLLDVSLWMLGSGSRNAQRARSSVGINATT